MTKKQAAELAVYKRSNKDRKKVLLERMGYKTQEEYFDAIGVTKKKKTPTKVKAKVTATKVTKTSVPTKANELAEETKPTDVALPFKNAAKISQVIEGTVYARANKSSYRAASADAFASGDTELIGAFKAISSTLD